MSPLPGRPRRQPRSVGVAYGAISTALLVLVSVVALLLSPPSPPAVAEFAPSALETLDEAPPEQSSRFGDGGDGNCSGGQDGCVGGAGEPAAADGGGDQPARRQILKARVRRCVGDPPRQTEDPQSPPCINYFEGDNGGATWKGVTRDTVTIVVPEMGGPTKELPSLLAQYFSRRYELYGRQLRVVGFEQRPELMVDPAYQRAAATKVDDQLRAFAAVGVGSDNAYFGTDGTPYYDELSRRTLVAIDPVGLYRSEAELTAHHPYQWSYQPTVEQAQRAFTEFACANLVGRPAAYSRDPVESQLTRRFGIVVPKIPGVKVDPGITRDGLTRCGAPPEVFEVAAGYNDREAFNEAVPRMRAAGVTTIACLCSAFEYTKLRGAVANANWLPELPVTGMPGQDFGEPPGGGGTQADYQMFGLGAEAKVLALTDRPWYQALKEVAPDYAVTSFDQQVGPIVYRGLLVLAAGIQAAGPVLTPDRFASGLTGSAFANPLAGGPPYFQGSIGFSRSDHGGVDDFAAVWYSRTVDGQPKTAGGWCYLERGRRHRIGGWGPRDYQWFDATGACR